MVDSTATAAALAVLRDAGLLVDSIAFDGALHRVPTSDKLNSKNGAYIGYADAPASLWWQDWASGESGTWTAEGESKLTAAERAELSRRMEESRRQREEEQSRVHAEAASKAQSIYIAAAECTEHPYLTAKGVSTVPGLKLHKDAVVVPLYDDGSKVVSLQFIDGDGSKRFLTGGRKRGCFFLIGGKDTEKPLIICEGLATGLSLHESLSLPVLVAFDAGNLLPVAEVARSKYPDREIIIAADNDTATEGNPGVTKATAAAVAVGGSLVVPRHEGRARAATSCESHRSTCRAMAGSAATRSLLMEGGKMWLSDLLPQKAVIRPTRPTSENHVGRLKTLGAVAPSDTSDTSDTKKAKNLLSGEKHQKEEEITQVSYKNPESVRHSPSEDVTACDPIPEYFAHAQPVFQKQPDERRTPDPVTLAHAHTLLVSCPSTGLKLHCWHCSRCGEARSCTAWRTHRPDVEFFKQSEKPYSLYLVEETESAGVLQ